MGLDIYFKEDIANILQSAVQALQAMQYSGGAEAIAFRAGWQACLETIATAFGLHLELPRVEVVVIERPMPRLIEGGSDS